MTEEERLRERLRYIHESITRIEEYTEGGRSAFLHQVIVQDAVLRRLETLADATNKLPDDLKARYPSIPWRRVYGFRNIAAHAYEEVDLARVWEIVELYLPPLKVAIEKEIRR